MFTLIYKLLNDSNNGEDTVSDEMDKCCAVSLIVTIIENVSGVEAQLPNILQYLIQQLQKCETPEYRNTILTAFCTGFNF